MSVDWTRIVELRDRETGGTQLPLYAAVDMASAFEPSRLAIAEIWLTEPLDVGHGPEWVFFGNRIAQLIGLRRADPDAPARMGRASTR